MDLLFEYQLSKTDKKYNNQNDCYITLHQNNEELIFQSQFDFVYNRWGLDKQISYSHSFSINLNNADFKVSYEIKNSNINDSNFKNRIFEKKNNFKMLFDLTENGFYKGEKRNNYWGVKYYRTIDKLVQIIYDKIKPRIKSSFVLEKISNPEKTFMNELYDLLVDYHLDLKGIKGHDSVYQDIMYEYPKKKWLEKNDFKFLPSVLDSYGIKSKYLISELSKNWSRPIHIASLNYLCKLFGKSYVNYLKQFVWELHCYDLPPNKKTHELKNEVEKNYTVSLIKKWETETMRTDSFIYSMNKLLSVRDLLEEKGYDLKFKAKSDLEFDNLMEMWSGYKLHFSRGYKLKYCFPETFIREIEKEFTLDGESFKPKLIVTEEDFRVEGFTMKNCMSKQFPHGVISIFVSLTHKRKKINLQYRKGLLIQGYGKANTPVPTIFEKGIDFLNTKIKEFGDVQWVKEKYDLLND